MNVQYYYILIQNHFAKVGEVLEQRQSATSIIRQQNRNRIFQYIYDSAGMATKQTIANDLSLSLPTVTQNLKQLSDQYLIVYSGTFESTGGRKPRIIDTNSDAKYSIGISVTQNNLRILCVDLCMSEKYYAKIDIREMDFSKIHETLKHQLNLFIEQNKISRSKILGVGIAFPGIISGDKTQIENAPTLKLKNFSLEKIYKTLDFSCYIDNDANFGALTEQRLSDNFSYLSVDRGIGGSVVFNQELYIGNTGKSAEFGHMCIDKNGPLCSCGKTGCLEAFCSIDRISEDFGCSLDDFFTKLESGELIYLKTFERYLSTLAKAINNLHMVMDSDIVIGGTIAQYLKPYINLLKQNIKQYDGLNADADYIRLSRYGSKTTCIGGAIYFIRKFIASI